MKMVHVFYKCCVTRNATADEQQGEYRAICLGRWNGRVLQFGDIKLSRVCEVEYSEYFKCALGAVSGFVNYVGVANLVEGDFELHLNHLHLNNP